LQLILKDHKRTAKFKAPLRRRRELSHNFVRRFG
jgi:hypothetical protein